MEVVPFNFELGMGQESFERYCRGEHNTRFKFVKSTKVLYEIFTEKEPTSFIVKSYIKKVICNMPKVGSTEL